MDDEEREPGGTPDPEPEGTETGGTEDTGEEVETGTEDEETTELSRFGEDTSVVTRGVEVSVASFTGGILRLRAR